MCSGSPVGHTVEPLRAHSFSFAKRRSSLLVWVTALAAAMSAPVESAEAQRVRQVRGAPQEIKRARRFVRVPVDPCASNEAPVADAGSAKAGEAGVPVPFEGSGSFDVDGSIESYDWSFGDGNTAYGATVTHTYANAGWYTVTLAVTDDCGARSAEALAAVTVSEPDPCAGKEPPVADAGVDRTADVGQVVNFDGRASYDPDGPVGSYTWDFGDGQTANGSIVGHAFGVEGEYTVTLTVTNEDDCGAGDSHEILVSVWASGDWTAEFTISPDPVEPNELVTFTAVAPPERVSLYLWRLDGPWECDTCGGRTITATYSETGSFLVSLMIMFADGSTASSEQMVVVAPGLTILSKLDEEPIPVPRGLVLASGPTYPRTVWAIGEPMLLVTADVSDPRSPRLLSTIQFDSNLNDIAAGQSVVAAAANDRGFYLFNSNDPINLDRPIAHHDTFLSDWAYVLGVAIADDVLFVTKGWDGLFVFDISNPANPQLLRTIDGIGFARRLFVRGDLLFVTDDSTSDEPRPNLKVFDVSRPENPTRVGTILREGNEETLGLDVLGSLLAVAAGVDGVELFDISTIEQPILHASIGHLGDGIRGVTLLEDAVYVSDGFMVKEYDVLDPSAPRFLEHVWLGNNAFSQVRADGLIYATFGRGIVAVISP